VSAHVPAEHGVLLVEVRGLVVRDEELTAVRVGTFVRHRDHSARVMLGKGGR
jgi:glyoxylate utilization-related uncharacterized protein